MNKEAILKEFNELNQCDGVIIHGYKDCSVCADNGNCGFQKQSRFVSELLKTVVNEVIDDCNIIIERNGIWKDVSGSVDQLIQALRAKYLDIKEGKQ